MANGLREAYKEATTGCRAPLSERLLSVTSTGGEESASYCSEPSLLWLHVCYKAANLCPARFYMLFPASPRSPKPGKLKPSTSAPHHDTRFIPTPRLTDSHVHENTNLPMTSKFEEDGRVCDCILRAGYPTSLVPPSSSCASS